jgi:hypothetical protein
MASGATALSSCKNDQCVCHIDIKDYPDWSTLRRQRHWCGIPLDEPVHCPTHFNCYHLQYHICAMSHDMV